MDSGYSDTPLLQKLGVKEGVRFALANAPRGFIESLGPLPPDVTLSSRQGEADVVLLFARTARALDAGLERAMRRLPEGRGSLWVAWPKRASGVATDLVFDRVQRAGLALGLVDTKICAVDDIWSGLRFSRRKSRR